ncbi:Bgt-3792 [Blumeria graminis f. sp. tritici]|uniref:Bgt-3792 n=2 Tax=Blumeria graminis f. sp. tritici TaxID=62690 RepID=A0A061HIN0_BLUGR|nr:histone H1-binding protein [Blumeria graminis f. sp. tritici 96224]VDB93203.1 Bgt-3792 [Blumeria graminis f. sp. tritici]
MADSKDLLSNDIPCNSLTELPDTTQIFESVKVSVADLCARGRTQYAHKNYEQAVDLYSRATELQAELNGELNPENAETLFLYGRSLFKLGQSKSDVLGVKTSSENVDQKNQENSTTKKENNHEEAEEASKKDSEPSTNVKSTSNSTADTKSDPLLQTKKNLFQFTGDENFDESDEEEEVSKEGECEEDDLAAAFDILDLARVLFEKKLKEPEDVEGKGKSRGDSPVTKHYKQRLADTHDLLAEISLENEKAALAYKKELYSEERSIIAEAHYKLSLALEFASITSTSDANTDNKEETLEIDQALRDEAIAEMEAAIESTRLKLKEKESELASTGTLEEKETTASQMKEVEGMLEELETRLVDLKGPAVDMKSALYGSIAPGKTPLEIAARLEEAKQSATDVTNLTRKKAKTVDISGTPENNGKRHAEEEIQDNSRKRVRTEPVEDKSHLVDGEKK